MRQRPFWLVIPEVLPTVKSKVLLVTVRTLVKARSLRV
jgi:hypothetical protein